MTKTDLALVLKNVNDIFKDVLENEEVIIEYSTTSADVPEWDSLNHIALVVAIEKKFSIQFTALEIQQFKNVGEMCEAIVRKTNENAG